MPAALMLVPFLPGMEKGFHPYEEAEEEGTPFVFLNETPAPSPPGAPQPLSNIDPEHAD